ncbi:hypothetical protein [Xanthobacter sp.]|uniref:hypothetical protein n=1 Tax=Xanthobacter sp. TaxID=35809 RepID=UPI0025D9E7F4|nr:hypothetical protein [Xanthobacter sp.]
MSRQPVMAAREQVDAALAEAASDYAQYLHATDAHDAIVRTRKLIQKALAGRGKAPAQWRVMVESGDLESLLTRSDGLPEGHHPNAFPSLLRLQSDPFDPSGIAGVDAWLELAARNRPRQGRRKGMPFFRALHLGYLFARLTGTRPTITTSTAAQDGPDDVEFTVERSGPYVDFVHEIDPAIPVRALQDAAFEGRYEFEAITLFGGEMPLTPTAYATNQWISRRDHD